MLIGKLSVSHNEIRHLDKIHNMAHYVENNGKWDMDSLKKYDKESKAIPALPPALISIVEFEDGWRMIHDGHHRCLATFMAQRDYLNEDEYTIVKWKYSEYLEINFEQSWVTPFDPRLEVRKPDFLAFKRMAMKISKVDKSLALEFIEIFKSMYCEPRKYKTLRDLYRSCFKKTHSKKECTNEFVP